ncbi:MAG: AI-2E family transporter [Maritimibacter sp.]
MALPVQTQAKYWGLAALVFLAALWWLGDVMLPFLIGGAVAYFLDPVADRLEDWGLSRALATTAITLGALVIFVIAALLIVPSLINQAVALVDVAPELFSSFKTFLMERFPDVMDQTSTLRQSLDALGAKVQEKGGELVETVLSSAMSVINVVFLLVVVPVVAFYLLLDWDNMVAAVDELLPRDHAPVVRELATRIDKTLASFIRGQGTVCLILGTFYAVALMIVGLQFGLVIGAIAGLITFIPYIGALVGGALAIGLALFQFWGEWWMIGAVGIIFVIGQFLEGNILTPKLVGSSVGLHPVWLLFALSGFGTAFGFVGMLVAVPVAASIGVIARYLVERYKDGRLYKGFAGNAPQDDDNTDA